MVGWGLNCPPPTLLLPPTLDVYSYDEDDMVLDPNLAEHLSHFGIDMLKMQKQRPPSAQVLSSRFASGPPSLPKAEAEAARWREMPR